MTDTWCPNPWIRYYSDYRGYGPCHEAKPLPFKSLDEYLASPQLAQLRDDLSNGRQNPICAKCNLYGDSQAGRGGPRANEITQHGHMCNRENPQSNVIKIVELRHSNMCNIKCRQCDSEWSSAIGFEEGKTNAIVPMPLEAVDDFKRVAETVELLHIGGGEPLLHPEYFTTLQYLIDIGRAKDVDIACSTNGSLTTHRGKPMGEWWKHFRKIMLTVTVDAHADQMEYWHYPLKWDKLMANIDYYRSVPNTEVDFHGAITWMSAFSFFDAYEYILKRYGQEILMNRIHPWWGPMDMSSMPTQFKPLAEARMRELQAISGHTHTGDIMVNRLENIIEYMYARDTSDKAIIALQKHTAIDAKRGQDFFTVFPEYSSLRTLGLDN